MHDPLGRAGKGGAFGANGENESPRASGGAQKSHADQAGQTQSAKTHAQTVQKLAAGENGILRTVFVILAGLFNHKPCWFDDGLSDNIQL